MKKTLLVLIILNIHFTADAKTPDCETLKNWLTHIESYSDGKDLNHLSGYVLIRSVTPIFHKEIFSIYFEKTFDQLTQKEKDKVRSKLLKCFPKNILVQYKVVLPFYEPSYNNRSWLSEINRINTQSLNHLKLEREQAQKLQTQRKERAAQYQKRRQDRRRYEAAQQYANRRTAQKSSKPTVVDAETIYRKEAAEVKVILNVVKNNGNPAFDFSNYTTSTYLQDIYDGNFQSVSLSQKMVFAQSDAELSDTYQKARVLRGRQEYLYIYLVGYSVRCADPDKEKYKRFTSQYETVTTENGFETGRYTSDATYYYLKPHFYEAFKKLDVNRNTNNSFFDIFYQNKNRTDASTDFPSDLKILFDKLPCNSPVLQKLETNLYLAAKGKSSLQKLRKFVK